MSLRILHATARIVLTTIALTSGAVSLVTAQVRVTKEQVGALRADSAGGRNVAAFDSARLAGDVTLARADAAMQQLLDAWAGLAPRPIAVLTPDAARRQPHPLQAVRVAIAQGGGDSSATAIVPGVRHVDRTLRGAAGDIPARVYTPSGSGPFPVIVYFHGGGWVLADKSIYDLGARGLAREANAIVVSVDYRLAPEHPFPAAHDDALAAYRWVLANARTIGGDPRRIALAGESAGGNLAVATAIAARDARLQRPRHVLAVYPVAQVDTTLPAYVENANAKPLDRATMGWFARHAVRDAAQLQDPRISILRARLDGLAPVTIVAAEIDPLRNDGQLLEEALRRAGVAVERRQWDDVTHEFFGMIPLVPQAREAQAWAGGRLRDALADGAAPVRASDAGEARR
ncbi:MAG: alpha/beta hydrolase [Gemmatimonadaceae bacterium]|nr:alpha/beta hydrolase [Gemmatimonadaceae bacterium]